MQASLILFTLVLGADYPVPEVTRGFLGKNCVGCHAGSKAPAGLDLSRLDFDLDNAETLSRWVRVHDAVERGLMPPG
ncbi:MAG: hypothetical protein NTW74_16055, partial [Acidobacteria bacterium]|nr:hypothetical protein [Acidobacteriota bacterium]